MLYLNNQMISLVSYANYGDGNISEKKPYINILNIMRHLVIVRNNTCQISMQNIHNYDTFFNFQLVKEVIEM